MAPPRKALITVTSVTAPMYPRGKKTGVFVSEALWSFQVFRAAGFEVDFVSETGKYKPDWLSQEDDWLPRPDKEIWLDLSSEFRTKLDNLLKPSDVEWSEYGILYASAGHASLIDYPTAKGLHEIVVNMYRDGRIIAGVCHGAALFTNATDPSTGKSIISGRKVTGFTTVGEKEGGVLDLIETWNRKTLEEEVTAVGAIYVKPPGGAWCDYVEIDGTIITGVNPQSARSTAEAAVKAFDAL
ncbi:class I glutamine amidotransferase-like protein [Delphinella strobiligena]|nr:class I glutamine amidotransferase-like protein [Delphinella strobiligena]